MKEYDYHLEITGQQGGRAQTEIFLRRLKHKVEERMESSAVSLARRERFETELIPLLQRLAEEQGGVLRVETGEERATAAVCFDGMLHWTENDRELIERLLPYEIQIFQRDGQVVLEVWMSFLEEIADKKR